MYSGHRFPEPAFSGNSRAPEGLRLNFAAEHRMLLAVVSQPPNVSIIIPSLGGDILSGRVHTLIESVNQQTMLPGELIVVVSDTDEVKCSSLLRAASQNLPTTVSFQMNCSCLRMNQADARNIGAWLATGELLVFHDADDQMHPQKVEMIATLFHQKLRLRAFAHSFTRSHALFAKPLTGATGMSLHIVLSLADSLQRAGAKSFWGEMLRDAAKAYESCTKRCWIVNGMVPGASAARRSVMQHVPFRCSWAPHMGKRSDGSCLAEDSLWFRKVLEIFRENDETLYMDMPLIFYIPSGFWKRPLSFNDNDKDDELDGSAMKMSHSGSRNSSRFESVLSTDTFCGKEILSKQDGTVAISLRDRKLDSSQSSTRKWLHPDSFPPSRNRPTVPKLIHFVWTSPFLKGRSEGSIPPDFQSRFQKWAVLNPEWEVHIWTDHLVLTTFDEIGGLLSKISTPSWTSDILRWTILERFGGVYLDADVDPVRNMNVLLEYFGPFVVCDTESSESHINMDSCKTRVANAIIGLPANHDLVYATFIKVVEASWLRIFEGKLKINVAVSGPAAFSDDAKALKNVTFLGRQTFQPCWGKGKQKQLCTHTDFTSRSDVFGVHLFKFSWKNDRAFGEKGA